MGNNAQVFAVVVNWNRPDDTLKCLQTLTDLRGDQPNIVLVDNGSTDDSVTRFRDAFPQAEILCSPTNLQFAGGYNLGIRHALANGADYIFIINNDAFVEPDTLVHLLDYAKKQDIGLLAPMIYHAEPPDQIWSMGGNLRPLLIEVTQDSKGEKDHGHWPNEIERDFVTGCCFLAPRETFERIGLFDEQFLMYYDDLDFSRRVRSAGLRILVIPKAKAWHNVASSSGGRDTPNERYWMARSSVRFFRKHGRNWRAPIILFWRLGSAVRTSWRLYRSGKSAAIAAYWRGLKDGFLPPTP